MIVATQNLDFIAMMGNLVFEEENERVRNLEVERLEEEHRQQEEARARVEKERREAERRWLEASRAAAESLARARAEAEERQHQEQPRIQPRMERETQLQRAVEMCRICKNNTAHFRDCPPRMVYCEAEGDVIRKGIAWCAYFVNEEGFTIPGLHIRKYM